MKIEATKKRWQKVVVILILLLVFGVSRWYILVYPPFYYRDPHDPNSGIGYSDVKHASERYANMWRYGLTPYREHLYEYPPGAIPLVYLPLVLDQAGIGTYYPNYRFQIFLIDAVIFTCLYVVLKRRKSSPLKQFLALGFYIGATAIAKDFLYDGLDLGFIGALTLALSLPIIIGRKTWFSKLFFWIFFWLSTAIKLMTLPLVLPFFWLKRREWRKELVACLLGFVIVWGLPLAAFRSSLSVMFVFHAQRPFNYGSFGKFIIQTINEFTDTEEQTDILPHYPMVGPVSTAVTRVFAWIFPIAVLVVLGYSLVLIERKRRLTEEGRLYLLLQITLIYIFTVFLSSKIFSNPFHIWYLPLLSLYPFRSLRQQLGCYGLAILLLMLDTTPWLRAPMGAVMGPVSWSTVRGISRFVPMWLLWYLSLRLQPANRVGRVAVEQD